MSELQIALIAIGAVIILAVLVINWWQERRFHRQVENSFSPLQRDALLDNEKPINEKLTKPELDFPNLDSQGFNSLDEPKFDTEDFYNNSNSAIDDRATDHFSIDEASENLTSSFDSDESDRYVAMPHENAVERLMQEEESIEDTYNEIVNTKLDKSISQIQELSTSQIVPQVSTADQASDFKEVFEDALNQQKQAEQPINIGDTLDLNADLSVSLPDMLHGQIDLTALLYLSADTPVSKLNKSLTGLFDNLDKPVFIHVLDSNKQWHLLKDIQSNQEALNRLVSKVACSLQLADRGGAVDRNVLNRFQLAVETLGLDVNGHVEWQNSGDALSAANSLDLFCIEVDKTIGFHLVHGESGAFTGTKLRGLAEAQGLLLTSDGAFKYFDQSSDELSSNKQSLVKPQLHPDFMMFNRDDHPFSPDMLRSSVVKGITFQLDIPHVKHATETFNHMIQVAKQMEIGLNAVLVDDNNKVLGDIQIERIRQQLKVLQATMLTRGVVPGSDNAHRLFS